MVELATFHSNDPRLTAADLHGTISWGDGTSEPISILTVGPSGIVVSGSHAYSLPGVYQVTVSLFDHKGSPVTTNGAGQPVYSYIRTSAVAHTSIRVTQGALHGAVGGPHNAVAGAASTDLLLYTFADDDPNADPNTYRVDVDWGDGTSSSAVGPQSPGDGVWIEHPARFKVYGRHQYAQPGNYLIRVRVDDRSSGTWWIPTSEAGTTDLTGVVEMTVGAAAAAPGELTEDPDLIVEAYRLGGAEGPTVTEGVSGGGADGWLVGRITIPAGSLWTPDRVMGVVDWGDGTQSEARLVLDTGTTYLVKATHTYRHSGDYLVTVKGVDRQANTAGATDDRLTIALGYSSAVVAEALLTEAAAPHLTTSAALGFDSVALAGFRSEDSSVVPTRFRVVVLWGDGTSSTNESGGFGEFSAPVRVVGANGQYTVLGSHRYAAAGEYRVRVQVTGPTEWTDAGQRTALTVVGTSSVRDAAAGLPVGVFPTGTYEDRWRYDWTANAAWWQANGGSQPPAWVYYPGGWQTYDWWTSTRIGWGDGGPTAFEGSRSVGTFLVSVR